MGGSQSSSISQLLDVMNQNTINVIHTVENESSQTCQTVQNLEVNILPTAIINCGLNFSQDAQVHCDLTATFKASNSSDISSLVNSLVDQAAHSDQKLLTDMLSTTFNNQSNNTDVKSYLKTILTANVTDQTFNKCIQKNALFQNQKINIAGVVNCPPGQGINFSQNAELSAAANCLSSAINDTIVKDAVLNNVAQKSDSSQTSQTKGVGDIISSVVGGVIGVYLIIAIILIGLAFAFVFLIRGRKKPPKPAPTTIIQGTPPTGTPGYYPGTPGSVPPSTFGQPTVIGGGSGRYSSFSSSKKSQMIKRKNRI